MAEMIAGLNLVLLGRTGIGKSASGNTILGKEAFISKKSSTSVTRDVAIESGMVYGRLVTVYDTPGLFNTEQSEDEIQQMINEKVLWRCESDPCVFLLVIKADRFTEKERITVEKIEKLLGKERLKKTWILFTRGDELEEENMTIDEFINVSEPLKKLVQKYDQRYHVFNNKTKRPLEQARQLLKKIIQKSLWLKDTPVSSLPFRKIVLLSQAGVGETAVANKILGSWSPPMRRRSTPVIPSFSYISSTCPDRRVSMFVPPGFFHAQMEQEELETKIARYVFKNSPHVFLIVFSVNMRFTDQEQQILQIIKMMFGEEVLKYSIILFTSDLLEEEPIEKLIEESSRLRYLVDQCGGRYHVFNNDTWFNRDEVNDLWQKIDTLIYENGGGHYNNEMVKDAQRFRQEEEEKRRQREEERRRREEEERKQREKQKDTCVCS